MFSTLSDWYSGQTPREPARLINCLRKSLDRERKRQAGIFCSLNAHQVPPLTDVFNLLSMATEMLNDGMFDTDAQAAIQIVRDLEASFTQSLHNEPLHHSAARTAMTTILRNLSETSEGLSTLMPVPSCRRSIIVLPVDVMYQARLSLFPAERMMISSGQRVGQRVRLGAAFDVTGERHAAHVSADTDKLGRALIAMDRSGTYFASWWHSHPGNGALATSPSSEDREQYAELVQHYSASLLGVILVADGWIRFWGTAIESGRISVEFNHQGIIQENVHEHIYRFAE